MLFLLLVLFLFLFVFFFLFRLFLPLIVAVVTFWVPLIPLSVQLLQKFFEFLRCIFVQGCRVVLYFKVNPLAVDVLVFDESLNLVRCSIGPWFANIGWHSGLPVSIHQVVVHVSVHFNNLGIPFVEVDGLDLLLELSVHARASQTDKRAIGDGSPSRNL